MRIQKGKIHFTKKDTWNLDHVLAEVILAGLQKYNLGSVNRQDTAEIAAE